MANYDGVNKDLADAGGLVTIARGMVDGRVKCILDSYTIAGTEAAGSTITLGGAVLPAGAKLIAAILAVSAAQTSLTFALGDSASASRYCTGHTGLQTASATGTTIVSGKNYVVGTTSGDNQLVITTAAATATAGTLYAAFLYSQD